MRRSIVLRVVGFSVGAALLIVAAFGWWNATAGLVQVIVWFILGGVFMIYAVSGKDPFDRKPD